MSIKILITGSAGQGVLWLGKKIAEAVLAKKPKFFVSIIDEYEAGVRSGKSCSQVVISNKPVSCPFIDQPDIKVELENHKIFCANESYELNGSNGRVNEEALKKIFKILPACRRQGL